MTTHVLPCRALSFASLSPDRLSRSQDVSWLRPPSLSLSPHPPTGLSHWFPDGLVNTSALCLDSHIAEGRGSTPAVIYDSPVRGVLETRTYAELREDVAEYAGVLQTMGVGKGDRVIIYCPMIPGEVGSTS